MLVIVNGQSTTDDDIDKDEINRLVDMVEVLKEELTWLTAEQAKSADTISSLKSQLVVSKDKIAKLENKGKWMGFFIPIPYHSHVPILIPFPLPLLLIFT